MYSIKFNYIYYIIKSDYCKYDKEGFRLRYNQAVNLTSFLQSSEFGEFQEKIPYRGKSWMLKRDGKNLCLVIRQKLRFGKSFLWVPYGPQSNDPKILEMVMEDLSRIAKEEHAIFARIESSNINIEGKNKKRAKKSFERYTPEATLVIDLSLSEEEILRQMKPKGRYNIRVAEKNGVRVVRYDTWDEEAKRDFEIFYKILKNTASRDGFHCHPKLFYEVFLEFFSARKIVSFFAAKTNSGVHGKVVGGILVVWYGDTATYYYGASDHQYRNFMASYLLQWEALKEAKKRGMKFYDFFGIAPEGRKNHPWAGVTEFKKKFGGKIVQFGPAYDIVYQPFWYFLYKLIHLSYF